MKGRIRKPSADGAAFCVFSLRIERSWGVNQKSASTPVLMQSCKSLGVCVKSRLNLKPGQKGTKKLAEKYGKSLLYVRYLFRFAD
jgi:hypothetical protein